MITNKKIRANPKFDLNEERKTALMWVKCYREALASPDRRYCVNPDPEDAPHTYVYATNLEDVTEHLLQLLENFGKHKTFDEPNLDTSLVIFNYILNQEKKRRGSFYKNEDILDDFIAKEGARFGIESTRTYYRRMKRD
jgi:hypothetical protein